MQCDPSAQCCPAAIQIQVPTQKGDVGSFFHWHQRTVLLGYGKPLLYHQQMPTVQLQMGDTKYSPRLLFIPDPVNAGVLVVVEVPF